MTQQEIVAFALSQENTAADTPFAGDAQTTVLRHADTKKWFGILLAVPKRYFGEGEGSEVCLNAKCPPELSAMLRQSYAGILPAYNMNKEQWGTVRLGCGVPDEEIRNILLLSRELTRKKGKVKEK